MAEVSNSSCPSEKPKETTNEPAPPAYYPPQQQPTPQPAAVINPPTHAGNVTTTTFVNNQPVGVSVVVPLPMMFGPHPIHMTCPHCQATIVTAITPEVGLLTWLACGGIALLGCWCGCCFIPFCINELQDCRHSCPNCNHSLGVSHRL